MADLSGRRIVEDITQFRSWDVQLNNWKYEIPASLPQRPPKLNDTGRQVLVSLNTYNVLQAPNAVVHQYDVSWGQSTDPSKRQLIKKIWASKAVQEALGEPKLKWVYDGNKLAWCGVKLPREETRINVDLDAEEGRDPSKNTGKNQHKVFVRWTRSVDFNGLHAFLNGKASWSTQCIDTINFLDHVMREMPSRKYTQIKKSFFKRGEKRFDLGGGVEAFKGVFSSLRPVLTEAGGRGLSINVDVANGTFWRSQELGKAIEQVFGCSSTQFIDRCRTAKRDWRHSHIKKDLARFRRIGVTDFHNKAKQTQWTIEEIGPSGMDCHEATFKDVDNPGKTITVYNYFKSKYGITLKAGMPVVKMTKKIRQGPVYLPLEFLKIDPNQRYNTKLSDTQTSQMIKFAVTLPKERMDAIRFGVGMLDWPNDPYLKHYGIKVNPNPTQVKAQVLQPPQVCFAGNVKIPERDLVQGRWRLDGKKFILAHPKDIVAWGVCILDGRNPGQTVNDVQINNFVESFMKIGMAHGMRFKNHVCEDNKESKGKPLIVKANWSLGGEVITKAFNSTGNHFKLRPSLVLFIVNDRNAENYRRIKRSCDCRYGVPSQVLQSRHVIGNQPQYISNVLMKVNAKLGGCTTRTLSPAMEKISQKHKTIKTMIVGADVSHPAPGAGSDEKASFAAITVSTDSTYVRYMAQCQTNGNRVEMVTTANIHEHFGDMAKKWCNNNKGPPTRVLFIRDGVSEGQYGAVLEEEVRDMKETFLKIGAQTVPKFSVVIAGKRHHIRFFPQQGDRNSNPLPGTLVETGCTHPFEFDFYMCSHVAIKGTARPIHYQCILNEGEWSNMELQQFLFEHSYQYVRSTTPVSLHPAVYYAHLAADRSRAHQNDSQVSSGKKEPPKPGEKPQVKPDPTTQSSTSKSVEVKPLMAIAGATGLKDTMWYV